MINTAARNNLSLTVAEPVALYMYSFNTSSFMLDQTGLQDASQTDLVAIPDGESSFIRPTTATKMCLQVSPRFT